MSKEKQPKGSSFSDSFKKFAQKAQNFVEESQSKSDNTKASGTSKQNKNQPWYQRKTTNPSEQIYHTWGWFWVIIITIIFGLMSLIIAFSQPKFLFFGILVIIAVPIIIIYSITQMIPTITIFGYTIFDRRSLSAKQQLSVGTRILRIFSREFIREAPEVAFFIFLFIILFIGSLLLALLG